MNLFLIKRNLAWKEVLISFFYDLDIETEKMHFNLVNGVESFDKNKLKPTVTQEKIILPDKGMIEEEKNQTRN